MLQLKDGLSEELLLQLGRLKNEGNLRRKGGWEERRVE